MLRLLIVDDCQNHLDVLSHEAMKCNILTRCAASIYNLFSNIKEFQPDLIIYDGEMHGLNAYDFAFHYIQGVEEKHYKRALLACLQPTPNRRHKALCEEFGFDFYDHKPITKAILLGWFDAAHRVKNNKNLP